MRGAASGEILGPIALIARHSATSLEALRGIAQHMHNYSPALRIGVHEHVRTAVDIHARLGISSYCPERSHRTQRP